MNKTIRTPIFLVFLFAVFLTVSASTSPAHAFSDRELDDILAPIALYPDPLLAAMLPASTYPAEIAEANAWLKRGGTVSAIGGQSWDESVKAIAYYPDILGMMADNLDWTADVGDAFLNQPEDVTASIQRLRWEAQEAGNLETNDKQQVVIDGDNVEIIPVQPEYMYVPQYDPSIVYENTWVPGSPLFITFGFGLAIGGWLVTDFDWRHHHVIYHGWNRPGWVNHARPYVHVTNVYVNRSRPFINQTWRHDMSHGDPERFRTSRPNRVVTGGFAHTPEVRGRQTAPPRNPGIIFGPRGDTNSFSNRGKQSLGTINQRQAPAGVTGRQPSSQAPVISRQPSAQAPVVNQRPSVTAPGTNSGPSQPRPGVIGRQPPSQAPAISRQPSAPTPGMSQRPSVSAPRTSSGPTQPRTAEKLIQPPKTPSVTFGGYRGGNEARSQSLRGESSRQSSIGTRPSPAPANRGGAPAAPAGGGHSGGKQGR